MCDVLHGRAVTTAGLGVGGCRRRAAMGDWEIGSAWRRGRGIGRTVAHADGDMGWDGELGSLETNARARRRMGAIVCSIAWSWC